MKGPKNRNAGASEKKNDEVAKNIVANVKPGSTVIVGVSGGPDSVYLFCRCLELKKQLRLNLIVAHVNHGLRGKASEGDETFVRKLCKKNTVPFFATTLKLRKLGGKNSKNLEEAGREERYKFFEKLRKRFKGTWILTAHHLNDNIETMLFNLIRGAHLSGIKGMAIADPSRHLLRPMLGMTKDEILAYLKKRRIPFRTDASNDDTKFSRNWLRKNIIPLFPKLNPHFEQTFKETLHNLTETAHHLEQQSEQWFKKFMGAEKARFQKMQIGLDDFLKEHRAFQKQLLVHLYKKIHGSTKKLTNKHLDEVLSVLRLQRANRKKEFGPGTFVEVVWKPQKNAHPKRKRYIRLITKK